MAFAVVAGISCSSTRERAATPKEMSAAPRASESNSAPVEIPPIVGLSVRDAILTCSWVELEIQIADGDASRRPNLNELFATIESVPAKDAQPGKEVARGSIVRVQLSAKPASGTTIPPILHKSVGSAVYRCVTSGLRFRVWDPSISQYRYPKISELTYIVDSIREPNGGMPGDPIDVGSIVGTIIVDPYPFPGRLSPELIDWWKRVRTKHTNP